MKFTAIVSLILSAFLLFYVQPFFGRLVLPYFGSSASVWITCLAFFQIVLLLGYLYTHFLSRLKPKVQAIVHIVILSACTLATLRLLDLSDFKEASSIAGNSVAPTLSLLKLLAVWIGPAYFVIATNSPLMQSWISKTAIKNRSVYRLYAISNIGSFIGLFAYPILVEPRTGLADQTTVFVSAFCVYAILTALSGIMLLFSNTKTPTPLTELSNAELPVNETVKSPSYLFLIVFCVAATTTLLLMGITQHLLVDMPPMPLMWSLLLGLYLLSFVVGFCQTSVRILPLLILLSAILITLEGCLMKYSLFRLSEYIHKAIVSGATLFVTATALNTWLYKLRPSEKKLTGYYLMMSLGGAASGVFVSIVAPISFSSLLEYPISLVIAGVMLVWYFVHEKPKQINAVSKLIYLVPLSVIAFYTFGRKTVDSNSTLIWQGRSFYGTLFLEEQIPDTKNLNDDVIVHRLRHGSTLHGIQLFSSRENRVPLSYYSTLSGVGRYIEYMTNIHHSSSVSVGLVGLGAGTLAAYGREGDNYTFYEIDPLVKEIAYNTNYFTFVSGCPANVNVVLGDARVSLEKELKTIGSREYDLLAIDAFSSDSIPVHLITKEAVEVYLSHIKDDGALAVHTSNRYINLRPIMKAIGKTLNLETYILFSHVQGYKTASEWVIFTRTDISKEPPSFLPETTVPLDNIFNVTLTQRNAQNPSSYQLVKLSTVQDVKPWTDDFHSIIPFITTAR